MNSQRLRHTLGSKRGLCCRDRPPSRPMTVWQRPCWARTLLAAPSTERSTWNLSATIRASGRTSSTAFRNGQNRSMTTVSMCCCHSSGSCNRAFRADSLLRPSTSSTIRCCSGADTTVWNRNGGRIAASSIDSTRGAGPVNGSYRAARASKESEIRHQDTFSRRAISDHGSEQAHSANWSRNRFVIRYRPANRGCRSLEVRPQSRHRKRRCCHTNTVG